MATLVPIPQGGDQGVIQTTVFTTGTEQIRPGTNTVFIGQTLTGDLTLALPSAAFYAAGRALIIKDTIGASAASARVLIAPRTSSSNTLNGGTASIVGLTGVGDLEAFSDGVSNWEFNPASAASIGTTKGTIAAGDDSRWAGVYGVPGAIGDGATDNTTVIQAALTAAGNAGGGIVRLGIGNFLCSGTLTIPPFVTLTGPAGCWQTHPQPTSGNWTPARNFDFTHGATLSTTANSGSASASPFVTIRDSAALTNIAIYHPNQSATAATPTLYPWAISLNGLHACVENVELVNPYQGILASNYSHRHIIRNVSGQPLFTGIRTDRCYDVARHENIHFVPNWSYKTGDVNGVGGAYTGPYLYARDNATAFSYGRSDDQRALNLFSFAYHTGYYFDGGQDSDGGCYGMFVGIGIDFATNPIYVAQTRTGAGVRMTQVDMQCAPPAEIGNTDGVTSITVLNSHTGRLTISDFTIRGGPQYICQIAGTGSFMLRGGYVDGFDRRGAGTYAGYANGGTFDVSDMEFASGANVFQFAAGTRGVVHDIYSRTAAVTISNQAGTAILVHDNL